ncbi:scavenger receptor cysteine-rich domain-containing protein DMBT1-like [Mytilus edulis]|uniref:scavenger receptor cysteine-rich domain-containing protein DMBT1-like n=1 Tax=Mytilus edulis TaxID=6550 RepID=UPI0039F003C9
MSSLIDVWIIFIVLVKSTRCSEIVRLIQANNIGVVQLNHNRSWVILCQGQSENKESKVICQELGHGDGLVLPVGYYGEVSGDYFNGYIKCDQGEDINNCSLIEIDSCKGGYLAVSCYDSVVNGTILSLNNSLSYGQLNWFEDKYQATGQICASSWDKEEAEVACHQLGYRGGLSTIYPKSNVLPFLVNSINCTGQEQNLEDCIRTEDLCESGYSAGVICFNMSGFNVNISDGGVDFGRVNIEVDGKIGTICNKEWSTRDAEVICRYIGFVAGRKWSGPVPPGNGTVYMSDLQCTGKETLITDCPSSGWRNVVDEDCLDHSHDAGVLCYGSVRLSGGETNDNVKMGRVEVYQGRQWTNLCTSKFEQEDATVVCRQLGYARARVLSSGIFGRSPYSGFTTDISCQGNENDILDCPHTIGKCKYSEYASVVCIKHNVTDDFQIYIDDVNSGEVRVSQYGIRGTVCQDGWDDNDAKVICHQNGYLNGQTFGTLKLLSQIDPIWLSNVECLGDEASIYDCSFSMNLTTQCSSNVQPAGVICYNGTGMDIRLVGGILPSQGRVEVARDGVWGTICDNKWSQYDANVVCQQLGFGKGSIHISSYHGRGTGSVLMDSLQCDGTESDIFDCPNLGWEVSDSACKDHSKDAGVSCLPWLPETTSVISSPEPETISSTLTPEQEDLSTTTDISSSTLTTEPESLSSTIAISTESSTLTTELEITIAISTESSTFTPEPESLSSTTDISTISSTIAISTESSTLTTEPEILSSTIAISTESSTFTPEPESLSSTTDISTISSTIAISTESSTLTTEPKGLSSTVDISTEKSTLTTEPEDLSSTIAISTESSTLTTEPENLSSTIAISTISLTTDISTVSSILTPGPEGLSSTQVSTESSTTELKSLYSSTDISTGSSTVIIGILSKENKNITWLWIVVTVLCLAVVILIIVLIKCRQGYTKRKWQRNSFSQHSFSNANIIRQLSDGSVHAENPLSLHVLEIQGPSQENQDLRANVISDPRYFSIKDNVNPVRHDIDSDGYMVPVSQENRNQPESSHANDKNKIKKNEIHGNAIQNCERCNTAGRHYYSTVAFEGSDRKNMGQVAGTVMDKKHVCPGCIINGDTSFNDSIRTYVSLVDSQIQRRNKDVDQSRKNESAAMNGVFPGSFINGDASFNDSIRTYVSLVDSQTQRKNIDVDQSRDNESPVIDGAVKVDIHQQNGQTKENSEYLTVVPDYSAIGTVSNDFIQSPNNFETKTRDIEDSIVKSSDFQPGSNKKRKNLRDSVKSTLSYQEEIDIEMPEMTTEL